MQGTGETGNQVTDSSNQADSTKSPEKIKEASEVADGEEQESPIHAYRWNKTFEKLVESENEEVPILTKRKKPAKVVRANETASGESDEEGDVNC